MQAQRESKTLQLKSIECQLLKRIKTGSKFITVKLKSKIERQFGNMREVTDFDLFLAFFLYFSAKSFNHEFHSAD